eukprot:1775406-Rhodomonas_salina.3
MIQLYELKRFFALCSYAKSNNFGVAEYSFLYRVQDWMYPLNSPVPASAELYGRSVTRFRS